MKRTTKVKEKLVKLKQQSAFGALKGLGKYNRAQDRMKDRF